MVETDVKGDSHYRVVVDYRFNAGTIRRSQLERLIIRCRPRDKVLVETIVTGNYRS